ncbi:maleylpyruvate isomerase family mycothiol-dependent enzyme [Sphaerisporangium flaviroseum]|uniref:Maleylpyruvate isomerase family mycothiol-dependent enzyme n=1 Tax=Sphaerisporangium flaviroseum TaxID=509199 RepID=A0ABP7IU50_9ACTN
MSVEIKGWSHEDYCSAIEVEMRRFVRVAGDADPAAEVPTCPGWTMTKLLKHLGLTQRWAGHIVENRLQVPIPFRQVPVTLPDDDKGYPRWLGEGAVSLVATLRAAGADTAVWSWGPDQRSGFWARRMLHEGTVHRADAEITCGIEPRIDTRIAIDGIDELLDNLSAAPWISDRLKELSGKGETLHFHATDVGTGSGEWMVTLRPEGFTWEHGHGKGNVAVRGSASDLILLLYGRLKPSDQRFELFGDDDLLARWLGATAL